jgi:hypothetical protein
MTGITSESYAALKDAHSSTSIGNVAFPRSELQEWQVGAIRKLAALRNLSNNWNSYGSVPVPSAVIDAAMDLVAERGIPDAGVPRVAPISGGGLQLSWERGVREFDIELSSDLTCSVLVTQGDVTLLEAPAVQIGPEAFGRMLRWVEQG